MPVSSFGAIYRWPRLPSPRDKQRVAAKYRQLAFVIALIPLLKKEPNQTVFGRVVEGMEVVCSFRRIDPSEKKEKTVQLPPDRIISAKVIRKRSHPSRFSTFSKVGRLAPFKLLLGGRGVF